MTSLRTLALATSIVLAAGCISHRERQRVFSLDAAPDSREVPAASPARTQLHLQRVLVPDYLDSTDLFLRVGPHEVRESASGRFGERLSVGITRALRFDLATRLPFDSIAIAPAVETTARQIQVTVDALDVWQDGRCVLTAHWSIVAAGVDHGDVFTADRGTFIVAASAGGVADDAAIVATMADAVSQLADRIASSVQALPP
jgi:uncharacterized lipoprotein YmbA